MQDGNHNSKIGVAKKVFCGEQQQRMWEEGRTAAAEMRRGRGGDRRSDKEKLGAGGKLVCAVLCMHETFAIPTQLRRVSILDSGSLSGLFLIMFDFSFQPFS
jgi:hypothetical protein